jgi:hypothetical protein
LFHLCPFSHRCVPRVRARAPLSSVRVLFFPRVAVRHRYRCRMVSPALPSTVSRENDTSSEETRTTPVTQRFTSPTHPSLPLTHLHTASQALYCIPTVSAVSWCIPAVVQDIIMRSSAIVHSLPPRSHLTSPTLHVVFGANVYMPYMDTPHDDVEVSDDGSSSVRSRVRAHRHTAASVAPHSTSSPIYRPPSTVRSRASSFVRVLTHSHTLTLPTYLFLPHCRAMRPRWTLREPSALDAPSSPSLVSPPPPPSSLLFSDCWKLDRLLDECATQPWRATPLDASSPPHECSSLRVARSAGASPLVLSGLSALLVSYCPISV